MQKYIISRTLPPVCFRNACAYFSIQARIVRSSAWFNNLPSCQFKSGYAFRKAATAWLMPLPPEVAKGIKVFPFKSWLSINVLTMCGATPHQMGKPM